MSLKWGKGMVDLQQVIKTREKVDWDAVRELFPITQWRKIQFNSGSAGVMPLPVQDHLFDLIRIMNNRAPYVAWSEWQETKKSNISRMADMLGVSPEELMVVRNTTEALNMILYGLPLKPGDQVIAAHHDYPFALNAIQQRVKRDGISCELLSLDLPADDDEVVGAYEAAVTPATRAILVTYMTHRHGHIMPVKRICEMAHEKGIQVVLDAAHAFGQFEHDLRNLGADYYATSLHKWLNAPHGCGLLYVNKDHINELHAHPSSNLDAQGSIDKYEHIGTRAFHQEIGIQTALDFHMNIGSQTKQARLHELKSYWTERIATVDRVHLHTDLSPAKSCAVATFSIDNLSGGKMVKILDEDYDIHAKSVGGKWGSGVRISVNVFTHYKELDRLVQAVTETAKKA